LVGECRKIVIKIFHEIPVILAVIATMPVFTILALVVRRGRPPVNRSRSSSRVSPFLLEGELKAQVLAFGGLIDVGRVALNC